jgi:hypothetical protein
MSELLLAALERLPSRARRSVVAVGALLALGAVMAALTLIGPHGGHKRERTLPRRAGTSLAQTAPRGLAAAVFARQQTLARRVGERFLAGYLRFAYGRGRALAVSGVTPALRRELLRQRARLTPVERWRRPRVVSLQTIVTSPTFAVARAVIGDGGVAAYPLLFTLEHGGGRWAVSSVEVG